MKRDPTRTKMLRLSYQRALTKRFKRFRKLVIPRLLPVILRDWEQMLQYDPKKRQLTVSEIETIVDDYLEGFVYLESESEIYRYMKQSYQRGVKRAVTDIHKGIPSKAIIISPYLTDLDMRAINLLRDNNVALVKNVCFDTRKNIVRIINEGILQGKGINSIAREMNGNIGILSRNRCKMISRTEIIRSYCQGSINKYKQAGLRQYEWITAFDERTCDICAGLDGKRFPVDGGERPPVHVNCRCSVVPVVKR